MSEKVKPKSISAEDYLREMQGPNPYTAALLDQEVKVGPKLLDREKAKPKPIRVGRYYHKGVLILEVVHYGELLFKEA